MSAVQADNNYRLALLDLSQLLELPTPENFSLATPDTELEFSPLTSPDEIYNQAMLYKPGIKAAEYRLEGSEKNVRIAKSSYYPQLSFSAGLGTNFYTVNGNAGSNFGNQMKNNLNKYAGFSLNIPLFNRLATRNRVRTARLQQTNLALYHACWISLYNTFLVLSSCNARLVCCRRAVRTRLRVARRLSKRSYYYYCK